MRGGPSRRRLLSAERNWSIHGRIKSANKLRKWQQTSLSTATRPSICRTSCKMLAGWKPDVVVHGSDEDSDSDASDEEKDLDEIMYSPETLALLTQ